MKNKSKLKIKQNSSPVCYLESDGIRPEFKEVSKPVSIKEKQLPNSKK